ncbi:MAG: peptide chain release factor N(5)-glutamine methyltransferase [Pyrinomonadaceae bacterium]
MSASIAESILEAAQALRISGVPEPRREASSLLQDVIGRDRTFIISHAEDLITAEQLQRFRQFVERRAAGEPLQYITGRQTFYGLDFQVTKDVLIPRPETELLVETALALLNSNAAPLVCDVGTGSGCIAVALLHENQRASAIGIDLSEAAIRVAQGNATRHSVSDRLGLMVADGLSSLHAEHPRFDLMVSNPPYVAGSALEGLQREVRDHEPRIALLAGPDGLAMIRRLLSESGSFIKTGGHLLIEIGFDQGAAVARLIDRNTWRLLDIQPDLQGIPRIVALEKTAS